MAAQATAAIDVGVDFPLSCEAATAAYPTTGRGSKPSGAVPVLAAGGPEATA